MAKPLLGAVLALACVAPAASAASWRFVETGTKTLTGYDEFEFLGWSDACAAGVRYLSFPPTGTGLQGQPDTWAIGTLSLPPDGDALDQDWSFSGSSQKAWDPKPSERAVAELLRAGYSDAGLVETLRDAPVAGQPGLAELILTTAAFATARKVDWPPARYRLTEIRYHRLASCAFLIFRDHGSPRDSYRHRLVRLLDPGARRARARAHVSNGLLLYRAADHYGAEEELAIAARMAPDLGSALYEHAVILATHGRFEESFDRLEAAIARDKKYAALAREAVEFESVRGTERFKRLVGTRTRLRFLKREYEAEDESLPLPEEAGP